MTANSSPFVVVVVLNYNGLEDTLRCLDSLRAVSYPRLSVVLVDNGSDTDPTTAAEHRYPGLTAVRSGTNLGFAGGNNRGIDMALERSADYVLVLNNDTVVAPTIARALIEGFTRDASIGILGPVINYLDEPDRVMTDGVRFNPGPGTEFFPRLAVPLGCSPSALVGVDIVNGCCMMIRADVVRAIGSFDESFFIVHEESDLCLRALRHGFRCAVLGETLVWHKGSSSFDRSGRSLQRYYDTRNLYYLLRRHTGKIPGSRNWIASVWHHAKYAFYRYSVELEAGKPTAAHAVAQGLWDAWCGRTGQVTPSSTVPRVLPHALSIAVRAASLTPDSRKHGRSR